ncbi:glycosyltransferase [Luteipulveratus halotolerans]|uniref:glycosyltransferase n=1 Tax=Luteipulveratus halotolerans TaxID=1631356 RepID=UPI0009E24A0A|nr:glycosyltransferase family 2 protein [Luteipulveratus halotolerans]
MSGASNDAVGERGRARAVEQLPVLTGWAPTIVAIVPAHNEAEQIGETIRSLLNQSVPPTRVVVVGDNCTDDTVAIARRYPVTVMETVDNTFRKSGAMNQAWQRYGRDAEFVLTMDADTTLQSDTVEQMLAAILGGRSLGAVCARYAAKDSSGLVWRLQRLEYARYDDNRELRGWTVQVSSGAASMYRGQALLRAVEMTKRPVPWDNSSLIEDYGLTLDLKTLGYKVRAADGAQVRTDTPATFRELWNQRLRWGRGGIDECRKRGWTPATRRDIAAYWMFGVGMLLRIVWLLYLVALIVLALGFSISLIGCIPLAIMWIDRVTSMWRVPQRTLRDVLLAAVMLIEDAYGMFLEVCTAVCVIKSLRAAQQSW